MMKIKTHHILRIGMLVTYIDRVMCCELPADGFELDKDT